MARLSFLLIPNSLLCSLHVLSIQCGIVDYSWNAFIQRLSLERSKTA